MPMIFDFYAEFTAADCDCGCGWGFNKDGHLFLAQTGEKFNLILIDEKYHKYVIQQASTGAYLGLAGDDEEDARIMANCTTIDDALVLHAEPTQNPDDPFLWQIVETGDFFHVVGEGDSNLILADGEETDGPARHFNISMSPKFEIVK